MVWHLAFRAWVTEGNVYSRFGDSQNGGLQVALQHVGFKDPWPKHGVQILGCAEILFERCTGKLWDFDSCDILDEIIAGNTRVMNIWDLGCQGFRSTPGGGGEGLTSFSMCRFSLPLVRNEDMDPYASP